METTKHITPVVKNKSIAMSEPKLNYSQYQLPVEIKEPIEKYINDIENYQMFMANNQIWIMQGNLKKHYFKSVSNFKIKIIQHMQDEKQPMKLLEIQNIRNDKKIFDVLSEKINTPSGFNNTVALEGNYVWKGGPKDFEILRAYLYDNMGIGKKIECLGWQAQDKFWLWNNRVNLCNGSIINIDDNGIFKHNNTSYYVPSANKVYQNNHFRYEPQKRVVFINSNSKIESYFAKMIEVHRNHSIPAILFSISSIFQDIVVDEIKGFPILFLQGKTSSGKDQLANCCQSLFGKPQSAINIEAGNSTAKAHIRELAQFINIISQFSEYKNGDKLLDGMLKGIWDRNGYKRGTIESHVSTETIPILSSLILTSNNTPEDDALITRLLWVDMSKNDFSKDEINKYDELAEMTKEGVSCFTDNLLQFRNEYLVNFRIKYRQYKDIISEKLPKTAGRISTNYAILGASYEIFKDKIIFPFTYNEMIEEFLKCSQFQINKINSASVTNKWWDCFLACIKINGDNKIDFDRDIKLEQNNLYFNFSNVYNKIQRQWYNQYKETMPSKTTMQDTIKKDSAFIEVKNSYRIKTGNDGSNTSAYVIDINKTSISDEIIEELHFRNTPA